MSNFSNQATIYVCTGVTDMRKSVNGMSGIVEEAFESDPTGGRLFCEMANRVCAI